MIPQKAPNTSVMITAAAVGMPLSIIETQTQPLRARTLPTDRSMHPIINTIAIPNASTESTLICRVTDKILSAVKNVSVKTERASTISSSAINIIKLRFKNLLRL